MQYSGLWLGFQLGRLWRTFFTVGVREQREMVDNQPTGRVISVPVHRCCVMTGGIVCPYTAISSNGPTCRKRHMMNKHNGLFKALVAFRIAQCGTQGLLIAVAALFISLYHSPQI
jgi:hypothetical protein